MIKHFVSAFLALVSADIAFGQCPLSFDGDNQAQIGIYVAKIDDCKPLVDYNSETLMTPASVMKSVTVAAALSQNGGNYRWSTTVKAAGSIADNTLNGNLIIYGSGDPTLGSSEFKKEHESFLTELKCAAADFGFSRIRGAAVEYNPWPDQGAVPSWELEDIPGIDGAGFYSLNWCDNVFTLAIPSMRTSPQIPDLHVIQKGGSGGLSYFRNPGSNELFLYGSLGRKQKSASFRCSMPYPPAVLLSEINNIFGGKKNTATNPTDTTTVLVYYSPCLRDVARSLMVRSDNQMAEATLRMLAPGLSRSKAITAERNILSGIGVNLAGCRIADGSGLSRHNAISPRQLGQVLRVMATNGDYVGAFARVGLDGTVRNFMKNDPARENFVLKSGSMTGVICYVGYKLDPEIKSPTHVIAIMINNAPDSKAARAAIATFLSSLD